MRNLIYLIIILPVTMCCSPSKKATEAGHTDQNIYIMKGYRPPRFFSKDTLIYYKTLWNRKYGDLKQQDLMTPYTVSPQLWERTMQKFEKNRDFIVPRLHTDPSYIEIIGHPELKTRKDFESCTYNIIPVFRETANAMDFVDTLSQDFGNFITLDTMLHLITIEKEGKILSIFSHIDRFPNDDEPRGGFGNHTQAPFRTDRILTARKYSNRIFAVVPAITENNVTTAAICFTKDNRLFTIEIINSYTKIDKTTRKAVGEDIEYGPRIFSPANSNFTLKKYFQKIESYRDGTSKRTLFDNNPQFIHSPEQMKK